MVYIEYVNTNCSFCYYDKSSVTICCYGYYCSLEQIQMPKQHICEVISPGDYLSSEWKGCRFLDEYVKILQQLGQAIVSVANIPSLADCLDDILCSLFW